MKTKLTSSGLLGLVIFFVFLSMFGLLVKILVAVIVIKVLIFSVQVEPYLNDNDKLKKDKPKLPAALAEKLAKRNKQ